MESKLVVVLFVCLAVQALGLPQAMDSDSILSSRYVSGDQLSKSDITEPGIIKPLASQVLKRSPSEDVSVDMTDLGKPTPSDVPDDLVKKMEEKKESSAEVSKVVPELSGVMNLQLPEEAKQPMSDVQDNVRAKKSTSMQEMQIPHGPHTTTVCIQVRSEHQPRVICGNPLDAEKKDNDSETKPRFAMRTPNDYYPHTYRMPYTDSPIQQGLFRAAPGMIPDRRPTVNHLPQSTTPGKSPVPNQGPTSMRPKAAVTGPLPVSMFPLRRSEEEPASPKIGDANLPQSIPGGAPIRINPQGLPLSPNSVIVHKQYYPYPQGYMPNMMGPSAPPSPLRLNCATDGGYLPYLRSGQPAGYLPIEERLIVNPMAPRMAEVPQLIDDQQTYIVDPQARQAVMDNVVGSPYIPDGLFIGDDGQTYMIHDTQSRSAVADQMMIEPQNQFLGEVSKEEKSRRQEEELQRSKDKLEELEKQINDIKARALLDEKKEEKKDLPEVVKNTQHELTATIPEKKTESPKNTKRNVYRQLNVQS